MEEEDLYGWPQEIDSWFMLTYSFWEWGFCSIVLFLIAIILYVMSSKNLLGTSFTFRKLINFRFLIHKSFYFVKSPSSLCETAFNNEKHQESYLCSQGTWHWYLSGELFFPDLNNANTGPTLKLLLIVLVMCNPKKWLNICENRNNNMSFQFPFL